MFSFVPKDKSCQFQDRLRPNATDTRKVDTLLHVRSIELFAGGGGLLLGHALAGFKHVLAAEWNKWACSTLRENIRNGYPLVEDLDVFEGDVRSINWSDSRFRDIDLVAGGPPCQPFSLGGKARAADDPRDMFPAMTNAIATMKPRAFIVENVRGLTRSAFHDYFSFIRLRLTYPLVHANPGETWTEHYKRLQKVHTSGGSHDLEYRVVDTIVNAADYGVPQHRHRVFIVGFRSDVAAGWCFPQPTHSGVALKNSQLHGDYWDFHKVPKAQRAIISRTGKGDPHLAPWKTVRDALRTLPEPNLGGTTDWLDHTLQPGARIYPGHTGSYIDEPSKALKAGAHGVPGGENMIRYPDGSVRYYSIREAARIQTFPDGYALHGAWGEAMRQLGNAVPVRLARIVSESVAEHLAFDTGIREQRLGNSGLIEAIS